jgi:transcriptional regulator with XRE-family HTH domain
MSEKAHICIFGKSWYNQQCCIFGKFYTEDCRTMELGKVVRMYRVSRGMTQPELSAATGLSVPMISRIEHGKKQLWFTEAVRLASALAVRLEDLAGITTTPEMIPVSLMAEEVVQLVTTVGESLTRLGAFVRVPIAVTIARDGPARAKVEHSLQENWFCASSVLDCAASVIFLL